MVFYCSSKQVSREKLGEVNQSKKQHQLAVSLLKKLGLDYVRLEPRANGHYRYHAWTVPLVDGNGSPRISRRVNNGVGIGGPGFVLPMY